MHNSCKAEHQQFQLIFSRNVHNSKKIKSLDLPLIPVSICTAQIWALAEGWNQRPKQEQYKKNVASWCCKSSITSSSQPLSYCYNSSPRNVIELNRFFIRKQLTYHLTLSVAENVWNSQQCIHSHSLLVLPNIKHCWINCRVSQISLGQSVYIQTVSLHLWNGIFCCLMIFWLSMYWTFDHLFPDPGMDGVCNGCQWKVIHFQIKNV